MNIEVYTVVRNEEAMLPWFLRHYHFARKIVLYDDGSSDRTIDIALCDPRVEIRLFPGNPDCMIQEQLAHTKNICWMGSTADYVIVVDVDEFIWHPRIMSELCRYHRCGVTLPKVNGYEMVSDAGLPDDDGRQLTKHIRTGSPSPMYGKQAVFSPILKGINFCVGSHHCRPIGHIVTGGDLRLLHYNFLGVDYIARRWADAKARVQPDAIAKAYKGYDWDLERLKYHHSLLMKEATEVVPVEYRGYCLYTGTK